MMSRVAIMFVSVTAILVVLLWYERSRRPCAKDYPDEAKARGDMCRWLGGFKMNTTLDVCGIATTSIFRLFRECVDFMSRTGNQIKVLMLSPNCSSIIRMLSEVEPTFNDEVVRPLADHGVSKLKECEVDKSVIAEVDQLLREALGAQQDYERYPKVIEACAKLWVHAGQLAMQKRGGVEHTLTLGYYSTMPYLKVWLANTSCFLGDYLRYGGKVGTGSPIFYYEGRRRENDRLVVEEILKRLHLIWRLDSDNTAPQRVDR
jgi:hypothetical protein